MNPNNESLIFFGEALKAVGEGVVEGYLVRFNAPDTTPGKEWFDSKTDFDFEGKSTRLSARFHHGFSVKAKKTKYGVIEVTRRDDGLWASLKMDMQQPFAGDIYALAQQGKLFWSSGSATHLVEKEKQPDNTTYIKSWPLIEGSLTPIPADPGAFAFAKSVGELGLDDPLIKPEPETQPATKSEPPAVKATYYSARSVLYALAEALYLPKSLLNLPALASTLHELATKIETGDIDAWSGMDIEENDDYFNIKAGKRNSKRDQSALDNAHKAIVDAGANCPGMSTKSSGVDVDEFEALKAKVTENEATITTLNSQLESANLLREDAEGQLAELLSRKG